MDQRGARARRSSRRHRATRHRARVCAPVAAARNVAFYALASVIGQLFVYFTITEFDPLVLSTVTTTRKIFSTVYSAARSPAAAMTRAQWGGCAAVFAAIAWETLEKYRRAHGAKRLGGKKNA